MRTDDFPSDPDEVLIIATSGGDEVSVCMVTMRVFTVLFGIESSLSNPRVDVSAFCYAMISTYLRL